MGIEGIQSVGRSIELLRLLAENGRLTATEAAKRLRIHQSSASRHLKSLYEAGFVRKPDFHSFAPDYGILLFAGTAMKAFPLVEMSAKACSEINSRHKIGAAVAVLIRGRLVYLAHGVPGENSSFHIVDESDFPPSKSSLGLILSHAEGKKRMMKIIFPESRPPAADRDALYGTVDKAVRKKGFLYLRNFHGNRFNAAMSFKIPGEERTAAAAIFSRKKLLAPAAAGKILREIIGKIGGEALPHNKYSQCFLRWDIKNYKHDNKEEE